MTDNEIFFNKNSNFYGNQKFNRADHFFLNFIKDYNTKKNKFLDIGGGSDVFSRTLLDNFDDIYVSIVDPSEKMLEKITDCRITKYKGFLPDALNLPISEKFDFILLKEVLHHITGKNIHNSEERMNDSLRAIQDIISDDGFLFIHEIYFETYLFPTLTRSCIFYLLKIQNRLNIQLLPHEFLMGLDVCFYTKKELNNAISLNGFIIVERCEIKFANTIKKKCLLLKDWGRILLIAKKKEMIDNQVVLT